MSEKFIPTVTITLEEYDDLRHIRNLVSKDLRSVTTCLINLSKDPSLMSRDEWYRNVSNAQKVLDRNIPRIEKIVNEI